MRLVEQAADQVQTSTIIDGDNPLSRIFLRSIARIRESYPDVVAGLDAGADEYLTKPVDQTSLVARVKSMLRVKELHDRVAAQAADLASWNKMLEHAWQIN